MLEQRLHTLTRRTPGPGFHDISSEVDAWLSGEGALSGLLTVFIRHTSASLTIQESASPPVRRDLAEVLDRLAPRDRRYHHSIEGPDDMPAHIRSMLTDVSLSIPVLDGRMCLGTWQGLYLVEHRDRPHDRQVVLHFLGSLAR
ncbi:secondary thiamine-phosphate synthase enzyme YjbQ [Lutibaculum baratangense]|uniref:Secondary thiamine-phosphate synthase enzyme n=1 Tax=Lutibaculum baratangense AMV1 TaxID=631454 RepID=V4RMC8_9HYPH|nr:secondary thiamine-phosphate synthase enzyme YjbQ [Lutibaculum baratangense]ESR26424.1 hypothetical protein N177_0924 [Lutibaculum baratangense AMV1]